MPNVLGSICVLFVLGFALIGCDEAQPKPTPTEATATLAPTIRPAQTLPPTWTPIPSLTPSDTPTLTPSPTETVSPTPTETLSPSALCDQFELTIAPRQGAELDYVDAVGFTWEGAPADGLVFVSFIHEGGEEQIVQFPSQMGLNVPIDLFRLSRWGNYEWIVTLYMEAFGELCPTSGNFFRAPWWESPIGNPLYPPFAR